MHHAAITPPPRIPRNLSGSLATIWAALLACSALLAGQAFAQSAPPAAPTAAAPPPLPASTQAALDQSVAASSSSGEIAPIQLSPFEVTSAGVSGYLASSAMSGTRISSPLKDIAAPVEVVTKDFMKDINATNLTSLLIYTTGTEVSGPGGNFSGAAIESTFVDFETQLSSATPETRVRGLVSADLSQDFFTSYVPMDSYNIERIEISRGPNAMLFGLGSPGGIINSALNIANTQKTKGSVTQQFGEYGSLRNSLDYNQVLFKDKLAIRLDTLYDNEYYRVHPAYSQDQRMYLAVTYNPTPTTTIRANAEFGNRNSNQPWDRPPFDGISMWWELGKPVYNDVTNAVTFLGTPQAPYTTNTIYQGSPSAPLANGPSIYTTAVLTSAGLGGTGQQLQLYYSNPNSSQPGIPGQTFVGIEGQAPRSYSTNGLLRTGGPLGLGGYDRFLNRVVHTDYTSGFWRIPMLTDPNIFDFYHEQIDGPNKYEWAEWQSYEAAIDQTFFNNHAGIELAVNKQSLNNGNVVPLTFDQMQIKVDINSVLPNGAPNPNLGRPVIGGSGYENVLSTDATNSRATAFYNLDLHRVGPIWLGRLLGDHVFTGAYTRQSVQMDSEGGYPFDAGSDYDEKVFGYVGNDSASLLHYVGPSMANMSNAGDARVQPFTGQWPTATGATYSILDNAEVHSTAPAANPWTQQSVNLVSSSRDDVSQTLGSIDRSRQDVNSGILIAQDKWFDGNLVSTIGWRRDAVWKYDAGTDNFTTSTGVLNPSWNLFYPALDSEERVDSWNWGAVAHTPEFINRYLPWGSNISLSYSDSSNFKVTPQRYNIYDQILPPEMGKTKEYGLRLSMFDGRFEFKIGRYRTADANSSSLVNLSTPLNALADLPAEVFDMNAQGYNDGNPAGMAAFNDWAKTPGAQSFFETFRYQINLPPVPPNIYPYTNSDNRSGEVVGTSNVVSTGIEMESVINPTPHWRIALNITQSVAVRSDTAPDIQAVVNDVFRPLAAGPAGSLFVDTGGVNTLADMLQLNVINTLNTVVRQDGAPTPELRRWHWNLVTNYDFTRGWLKGFNVAGGIRWEDKAAIGYPVIPDPANGGVSDVKHPYYSPEMVTYDGSVGYNAKPWRHIKYHVQLYLQNIGVGDELIPIHAQPDGSIDAWEIREPMKWTLSNTFAF
ncbi:MAG: TonB-dependent receptor plug domain-containing protein [Opitutaceae bacterium]